jgi:hypothetical protein
MKKSELKQIIQEEIQNVLVEAESTKPRYKKGDILTYRGTKYTVSSDNGYTVNVTDNDGKKKMFNYSQLNQGSVKKFSNLNEMTSVENLPGYNALPDTDKNIDWNSKNRKSISLPSLNGTDGEYTTLFSKEAVQKWKEKFISKWKLKSGESEIEFSTTLPFEILNASDEYYTNLGTSGEEIRNFYTDLKYKGD